MIGTRQRKIDGVSKATGAAIYADDLRLPRMLHCALLRSPHPHAAIRSIDFTRCLALPGVVAVLSGQELTARFGILPWAQDEQTVEADRARFIGDAIAAVAAIDPLTAERALELIDVDYQVLPYVLDPAEALSPDAPKLHAANKDGNVSKKVALSFGDVEGNLAKAAQTVEASFFYEGSTHAAIEPHCAVASWAQDGQLTVWSSTQVPHYLHRALAEVLGLPAARIRVIQPAVGGGFGGKSEPFGLELAVARLSMKTGRPVKCRLSREEVFYVHRGRHPMRIGLRLGCEADGRISAVDSEVLIDGGAYSSFGPVTTFYAGQLLTGPYDFGAYGFKATRAFTNKPPCGPKRGHGSVQPRFALEVAIDLAAEKLKLDPLELRRRNALGANVKTINGMTVGSNAFVACLDLVEKASGWKERRGKLGPGRGLGVAGSMYISGTAYPIRANELPQSAVQIRLDRSGRVVVYSGGSDIGQGMNSMIAYLVADVIGCELGDLAVVAADTDLAPVDLGSYSSRGTYMVGLATLDAAEKLRRQLTEALAAKWECGAEELSLEGGKAWGPRGLHATFAEVVQLAEAKFGALVQAGSYWTRKSGGDYRGGTIGASPAYSFSAHVAEVEVDLETGLWRAVKVWAAHDCGQAINPVLVEGQIEGCVSMGLGEAQLEAMTYHPSGLHRGPNLLAYPIPTAMDSPEISALIAPSHEPSGPKGAKEAGEGPLHPIIPAVANALYDATGVRLFELPFTPAKLLAELRRAR